MAKSIIIFPILSITVPLDILVGIGEKIVTYADNKGDQPYKFVIDDMTL